MSLRPLPMALLLAFAAALRPPPSPAPDQEPLRIVREMYAPYAANRPTAPGALALIRPHAAPELVRLIDRRTPACAAAAAATARSTTWSLSTGRTTRSGGCRCRP